MDVKPADPEHYEQKDVAKLAIYATIRLNFPPETQQPGINSILVHALIEVAGEITSHCPAPARGAVVEQMQDLLAKVAKG